MAITRQLTAHKLTDYLQHRITIAELVDWAENAVMEEPFDDEDGDLLRDIVGRLGLSDVRAFGLTWEDCDDYLARLGYRASITVDQSPAAKC